MSMAKASYFVYTNVWYYEMLQNVLFMAIWSFCQKDCCQSNGDYLFFRCKVNAEMIEMTIPKIKTIANISKAPKDAVP